MRTNPFWDALLFLIEAKWTTAVLWALLLGSVAIAIGNLRRDPGQRTLPHLWAWATRVAIAVSLLLGVCTRLGGLMGALMAVNLWLGLYRAPYEWPWTYFLLIVVNGSFAVSHAGRSLGLDVWLSKRAALLGGLPGRLLTLAT